MTTNCNYLALDLGAESGRAILGVLDDGRLNLQEIHRFGNSPVRLPDGLHWDVLHLWDEIKAGMAASMKNGVMPRSDLTVKQASDRIENEDTAARYGLTQPNCWRNWRRVKFG